MKRIKEMTWDDLADFYHQKTGGHARTQPMNTIYKWATEQPEIRENENGTLSLNPK